MVLKKSYEEQERQVLEAYEHPRHRVIENIFSEISPSVLNPNPLGYLCIDLCNPMKIGGFRLELVRVKKTLKYLFPGCDKSEFCLSKIKGTEHESRVPIPSERPIIFHRQSGKALSAYYIKKG